MTKFNYSSVMEVPYIEKIVINIGVGDAVSNSKLLDEAVEGNTLAAMVIILYVVIIVLFIYNLLSFRKKKVEEVEDDRKGKDAK